MTLLCISLVICYRGCGMICGINNNSLFFNSSLYRRIKFVVPIFVGTPRGSRFPFRKLLERREREVVEKLAKETFLLPQFFLMIL